MTLHQIDDIELLRRAALLLQEDNKKLVRLIAKMKKELHALRGGDPEHLLDQADQVCSSCGGALQLWDSQHEASEEIDVVELKYVIKQHLRQKYRCRCGACIETAPGPQKLFAGARYSVDFALSVAIAKYADRLPLERQVKMKDRHGLYFRPCAR